MRLLITGGAGYIGSLVDPSRISLCTWATRWRYGLTSNAE